MGGLVFYNKMSEEELPVLSDEEDEVVIVAAITAVLAGAWWQQWRRRCLVKRRWAYHLPYEYVPSLFLLELMPTANARVYLRFTPEQIRRLVPLLGLDSCPFHCRYKADSEMALCVLAARLSSPGRWEPLSDLFGRSKAWLSTIFNDVVLFLAAHFGPLLWWHPQLTYSWLAVFSKAVEEMCGVEDVWGFVDGTFRGYCHPQGQEAQQRVYSGHKKSHGNNYQAIVTPDGLVSSLTGPWTGPTNDWTMWCHSGVEDAIWEVSSCSFLYYFTNYILNLGYEGS